jgi:phage terminase large subunit
LAQGLWVAAEGTIWTLPEEQIREPEQTRWHRVVAGIDWGYVHAFACEVVAESGTGRRATIDELYSRGRLLGELIPDLLELQDRYGIEAFYADPSEPAYIEHCRREGLRMTEATNDILPGIDAVAASIKEGETVSPRCSGLLAEILEYSWQRDRSGEQRERPIAINDDACDAWRYAHMGLEPMEVEEYILVYDDPVEISRW